MSFTADIRRWPTLADFEAHLAQHDPAAAPWAKGVTLHHTYTPTLNQWRGLRSVEGTRNYYIGLGWSAGPHLFIALGSPRPEWDGIYQLTPLTTPGIHAGACNSHMWGAEIVGRYDDAPWSAPLAQLVYGVTCALLRWRGLGPIVQGHRECLPNKSCPGNAINMAWVREEVRHRLGQPAPGMALLTEASAIMSAPRCTLEQLQAYLLRGPIGGYVPDDVKKNILPAYWRVCTAVDVDPLVAIAQLDVETRDEWQGKRGALCSFWSQRPQRNPAGIGVDGSHAPGPIHGYAFNTQRLRWEKGVSFATWADDAIPAHVGRLLAYATKPGERSQEQMQLVARAMSYRLLPAEMHGSAPRLRALGKAHNPTGEGWAAPGHDYGAHIARVANAIRGL